jgi:hypothetical protein
VKAQLATQDPSKGLAEALELFPMRPDDATVLNRYVLGQASKEEAEFAFQESLRDPRWMMRWFAEHHGKLTPIVSWVRSPAEDMAKRMQDLAAEAKRLRQAEHDLPQPIKSPFPSPSGWKLMQDKFLLGLANRLLLQASPTSAPLDNVDLVDQKCPGLSTAVRSLHSSLWNSVSDSPRDPKASDFVDVVHAMHAPYTDFFRADRYMSQFIGKHTKRYGTEVVSRLDELPDRIRKSLS